MSDTAHGITAANILATLPPVLAKDESKEALAQVTADILAQAATDTLKVILYKNIDDMGSELLDILANDFDVAWWSNDYSVTEKRRTLKDSWHAHRVLGTKKAVEMCISDVYPDSTITEWFDYGGQPYHFKVQIDSAHQTVDPEKYDTVISRIAYHKNLRSYMDGVEYIESCTAYSYEYTENIGTCITDGATASV